MINGPATFEADGRAAINALY